jgi:pyruvate dehydrogenase E1 component alpha subunit/2-oxoisovalerate dehydrogenase E1 component alpha subunit
MKMQKATSIAVGFCGDGATSEPDFHSAMNFAGVFQVPCVLVCQNNHWSISVPTEKQTASRTIAVKGRAYAVPSMRVDGNDFLAVYTVLRKAFEHARSGKGPFFVEAVTYRMGAHTTSDDPTRYRTDAEVAMWAKRDPIERLARHLGKVGLVDEASDKKLEEELTEEVIATTREVEALPLPQRGSIFEDVYAEVPWHLAEQRAVLEKLPPAPTH